MANDKLRKIRTVPQLMLEDAGLTLAIYAVFALYCSHGVSYLFLQIALLIYVIRVFALRHERAHLPAADRSNWRGRFSDLIEVYHTPYQEPFLEKRRKHLLHHAAHLGRKKFSALENAHDWLEGSLPKALLSSAFYHELMLVLDICRERKVSRERLLSFAIASAMVGLTIAFAGLANFAAFFVAYRVASFVAWFSFSYVLHLDFMFEHELGPRLSSKLKAAIELVLGQGSVTAIFYHQFHHRHPSQFHEFSVLEEKLK